MFQSCASVFSLLGCAVNDLVGVEACTEFSFAAFSIFSALADLQKVKVCQREKMRPIGERLTWEQMHGRLVKILCCFFYSIEQFIHKIYH